MAQSAEAQKVLAAIETFYMGSDPERRAQAHDYLLRFHTNPQAWEICIKLLQHPNSTFSFYSAKQLHQKVKAESHKLENEDLMKLRNQLIMSLGKICKAASVNIATTVSLASSIVHITIHRDYDPRRLLDSAFKHSDNPYFRASLLEAIPEEAREANLSFTRMKALEENLGACTEKAIAYFKSLLSNPKCPSKAATLAFQSLIAWLHTGISTARLVQSGIFEVFLRRQGPHLEYILEVWSESVKLAKETEEDQKAVFRIISSMAEVLGPRLANALKDGDLEECRHIGLAISTVCEEASEIIARGDDSSLRLVSMILDCTEKSPLAISELTFDFWLTLNTIEIRNRHPSLRHDIYFRLLKILLQRLRCPSGGFDAGDFIGYRAKVEDVLITQYELLDGKFFGLIGDALENVNLTAENSWQLAEACGFALVTVADNVNTDLEEGGHSQLVTSIRSFVFKLVQLCRAKGKFLLAFTTLRCIEGYARYLVEDRKVFDSAFQFAVKATSAVPSAADLELLSVDGMSTGFQEHGEKRVDGMSTGFQEHAGKALYVLVKHASRRLSDIRAYTALVQMVQQHNSKLLMLSSKDRNIGALSNDSAKCQCFAVRAIVRQAIFLKADGRKALHKILEPQEKKLQALLNLWKEGAVGGTNSLQGNAQKQKFWKAVVQSFTLLHGILDEIIINKHASVAVVDMFWDVIRKAMSTNWLLPKGHVPAEFNAPDAVCRALIAVLIIGEPAQKYLKALVGGMVEQYLLQMNPYCLSVLVEAIRCYGKNPSFEGGFREAYMRVAKSTCTFLLKLPPDGFTERFDMIKHFLDLTNAMLSSYPMSVIGAEKKLVPFLLRICHKTFLHIQNRSCVRSSIKFLKSLINSGVKETLAPQVRSWIQAQIMECGRPITEAFLISISSRKATLASLASAMYKLLVTVGPKVAHSWMRDGLGSKFFEDKIAASERKGVLDRAVAMLLNKEKTRHHNPEGKFKALMADFAQLCEFSGSHVNVLTSYHLDSKIATFSERKQSADARGNTKWGT
eukprot:CAMPEP_0114538770 /NCGR_PEP_ID=MMETSP0109-20121206/30328_1 /TAXON_ID=29199 /ORGANISM="Chlorarachnion reptans, Strain CCCM449" /LENGTH=1023 /DNA_ID=CAMNT_0001722827 /DNA_START=87 /DNA_END=3159 /DNA_ORIENTATION=+